MKTKITRLEDSLKTAISIIEQVGTHSHAVAELKEALAHHNDSTIDYNLPEPKRPYKITGNLSQRHKDGMMRFLWIVNGWHIGPTFGKAEDASNWMDNLLRSLSS